MCVIVSQLKNSLVQLPYIILDKFSCFILTSTSSIIYLCPCFSVTTRQLAHAFTQTLRTSSPGGYSLAPSSQNGPVHNPIQSANSQPKLPHRPAQNVLSQGLAYVMSQAVLNFFCARHVENTRKCPTTLQRQGPLCKRTMGFRLGDTWLLFVRWISNGQFFGPLDFQW